MKIQTKEELVKSLGVAQSAISSHGFKSIGNDSKAKKLGIV